MSRGAARRLGPPPASLRRVLLRLWGARRGARAGALRCCRGCDGAPGKRGPRSVGQQCARSTNSAGRRNRAGQGSDARAAERLGSSVAWWRRVGLHDSWCGPATRESWTRWTWLVSVVPHRWHGDLQRAGRRCRRCPEPPRVFGAPHQLAAARARECRRTRPLLRGPSLVPAGQLDRPPSELAAVLSAGCLDCSWNCRGGPGRVRRASDLAQSCHAPLARDPCSAHRRHATGSAQPPQATCCLRSDSIVTTGQLSG